jgi:hypothetical protein
MAVGVNIVSTFDSKGIDRAIRDFKKIDGAGNKAAYSLRTFDKAATNGLKNVAKFGGLAAAGFGAVALNFVKGAEFAKQADDRLAAVNKTMGLFGAQTDAVTKRLIEIGDKGEYKFGILAESIKDVQSKLLTFKEIAQEANVTGGLFDRATQAALDLQAAGFGEATQNAVQLGKALNDPVKGITALARSGVTFTEQEKEKIKALVQSGKMYEAQEVLLKAIEAQVGGTAEATATATFKIGAAFGHVRDELGTLLLPLFEKFANFMINTVVPYATKFSEVVGEQGMGAGLRMLAGSLMGAISGMGAFGNTMLFLVGVFATVRAATIAYNATIAVMNVLNALAKAGFLGTALGVKVLNIALIANPIGLVVAGFVALIAIIALVIIKFEAVRDAIASAFGWLGQLFTGFKKTEEGANAAASGINRVSAAFDGLTSKQLKTYDTNRKFFRDSETGASKLRTELLKGKGSLNGFSDGAGGAGKAVETAKEKLQKYIDALKGMSSAQKSARDADKSLMKSRTSLAEATTKLTDAQTYFNQVVAGYGANSKQAKDRQLALRKAQGAVETAGYDVESSVFAVSEAEKELAAIRLDPESSAQAIREAEIALAEAKLSVTDATESQVEATDALAEAERLLDEAVNGAKEGTDAYTDALDKLNDAKQAQVDATDAVTEAIERQTEAVERLLEAEEKARTARVGGAGGAAAEAKYGSPFASTTRIGRGVAEMAGVASGVLSQGQADDLAMRRYTPFATGGIVTKPTLGLLAEAGQPEAVIPLDRLQSGMTVNLTINAGMGTDPAKLGDEIVDVLTRYQRRNGALPLKVA